MTPTPARPVPAAGSVEQRRLEVELLHREPVLSSAQLARSDRSLMTDAGPLSLARARQLCCLALQERNGRLSVAVPSDWDLQARQALIEELAGAGYEADLHRALACDIAAALDGQQQHGDGIEELVPRSSRAEDPSPVVSLVDRILIEAIERGASDIHVEPQEQSLTVRYRLDGVLQRHFENLPKSLVPAVTSRLKIMAELDIAERRLPQDGRIRRLYRGRKRDFRVSTLPSRHGEKVVLRLLDSSATRLDLGALITNPQTRRLVRELGSRPYGMIVVSGPTGSGKSTTLYSLLAERNDPGLNISTVEDPIEYTLPGITQTQVNRDKGLDFGAALRAFLRQDPDVLLVGETRDLETARTAIEAALTGHLVLTTLHCSDAPGAIARLDEMGVEPYLVSASLLGIVSQRLLRRVCSSCRQSHRPPPEQLSRFGLLASRESDVTFYRATVTASGAAAGCPHCQGSGYRGRIGVYEVLCMNEALAAATARRASTDQLRRLALESGMTSLLGYGLELVREGHTTLDEVDRMLLTASGLESEQRARALSSLTCRGCGGGLRDEWLECPYCLTSRQGDDEPLHRDPA